MAKILITGSNGTVGEVVGDYLCPRGHEVIGVSKNIEKEKCYTNAKSLNLLDEESLDDLEDLMEDADAVFHLAWNLDEENFDTDSRWEGNMEMFHNVLNAARNSNVPIFINGSSIHAGTGDIPAYTAEASLEKTPEPYRSSINPKSDFDLRKEKPGKLLSPIEEKPDSPYGKDKIETEHQTREAVENGDFRLGVSIRIGGVNSEGKKKLEGEPYYSTLYWSHKDLGRTIENIITANLNEKSGYHQFYGVSDNEGRIFSIEDSFIRGY